MLFDTCILSISVNWMCDNAHFILNIYLCFSLDLSILWYFMELRKFTNKCLFTTNSIQSQISMITDKFNGPGAQTSNI